MSSFDAGNDDQARDVEGKFAATSTTGTDSDVLDDHPEPPSMKVVNGPEDLPPRLREAMEDSGYSQGHQYVEGPDRSMMKPTGCQNIPTGSERDCFVLRMSRNGNTKSEFYAASVTPEGNWALMARDQMPASKRTKSYAQNVARYL